MLFLINTAAFADLYDACCFQTRTSYPNWFVLFYLGKMTNNDLGQVIKLHMSFDDDTLYSLEVGKELSPGNSFRQFFQPIVSTVDVRGNLTILDDYYGCIYEFNPYFTLNWRNFPWCHTLLTTIAIGEGLSYVSKVPYAEEKNSDQPKRLLNFLLFEIAFAMPCHPEWEFLLRIHHRSGAFGIYHANNAGSTAVGVAVRYHF